MKIVAAPNEVLIKRAQAVEKIDAKTEKLVAGMIATLNAQTNPQGVGLAAPQVGISLKIFIIKPTPKAIPKVFINPHILKHEILNPKSETNSKSKTQSRKKKNKLEGCLSIPQIWGGVKRAAKVQLEFQDLTGQKFKKWFAGFAAIIIQHEMDHLAGVLFTQRVLEQDNKLFKEEEGKLKEYEI